MIMLALRLLGWGKLALTAAVSVFQRWPRECAIVVLLCLSAWLWRGLSHERAGRKADAVAFQTASDEARAKQAELRAAEQADYERKADAADQKFAVAVADARSATADYAARMRADRYCRPPRAVGQANDPEGIIGPRENAVVVTRDDLDILTENTLRLQAAHEWAAEIMSSSESR